MYENNKNIGWKKKENNGSNGSYDDSLIKNQINILDNKIDEEIEEVNSQLAHKAKHVTLEQFGAVGDVKYMWGTCIAYTQKTLDCSKILNVQLTLTEFKSSVPFVTISGNTFMPQGDGNMNYFAVCVI